MLNLFWIFEHITSGPFYGLLSVNFAHAKSYPETFGHLYSDFLAINVYQGVKICNLKWFFFVFDLVDRFPSNGCSSNFDIGWVVDKASN